MGLEQELNRAYRAVTRRFSVQFTRPGVAVGIEREIHGIRDLYREGPEAVYDDERNLIRLDKDVARCDDAAARFSILCHMLSRALTVQVNPALGLSEVGPLLESDDKRAQERGAALLAFDSGLAEYVAVESCLKSGEPELAGQGHGIDAKHLARMQEWFGLKDLDLYAEVKGLDPTDRQGVFLRYLQDEPWRCRVQCAAELGYSFVTTLRLGDALDLLKAVKSPPRGFAELVYPAVYRERVVGI